jgi:hypothetical protein
VRDFEQGGGVEIRRDLDDRVEIVVLDGPTYRFGLIDPRDGLDRDRRMVPQRVDGGLEVRETIAEVRSEREVNPSHGGRP